MEDEAVRIWNEARVGGGLSPAELAALVAEIEGAIEGADKISVFFDRDTKTKALCRVEMYRAGRRAWGWSPPPATTRDEDQDDDDQDDDDAHDDDQPLPELVGADREWDLLKGLCWAARIPTDVGTSAQLKQRLLKAARDGMRLRQFLKELGE